MTMTGFNPNKETQDIDQGVQLYLGCQVVIKAIKGRENWKLKNFLYHIIEASKVLVIFLEP